MIFKRFLAVILAVLMAAALIAFAACSGKDDNNDDKPTEEPTEEPTAEPTEEPSPYAKFDDAFARFNAFISEPNASTIKGIMPEDFFTSLEDMLTETFEQLGISFEETGYASFDAMLEEMLTPEAMLEALTVEEFDSRAVRCDFDIKSCEETGVDEIIDKMGEDVGEYLDAAQITEAYELTADVTVVCEDGSSKTEPDQSILVYMYGEKYYIAFDTHFEEDPEDPADPNELTGKDADPEEINEAFNAINDFIMEPDIIKLKSIYPADFFENVESYLVGMLADNDMTLQDLGYSSFDDFLASIFDPEEMKELMVSDTIGRIQSIDWEIKSCEEVPVSDILEQYGDTIQYLDSSKITAGYMVVADMTAIGEDGRTETSEAEDVFIYVYEGRYYILFA